MITFNYLSVYLFIYYGRSHSATQLQKDHTQEMTTKKKKKKKNEKGRKIPTMKKQMVIKK